jgi:formylmethanofuran dehydrogenase subunit B
MAMPAHASSAPNLQLLPDRVCLACGCLCDDITLSVEGNRIVAADRACPIGRQWFLVERPADAPVCRIDGRPAALDDALERAARILSGNRRVLVFGLGGATCEAQRAAVALADRLGACLAIADDQTAASTAAIQSAGMVTATLGEVRHRADLVIFWGVDPATTHPRHFERYSLDCPGEFVPRGRADRTCVVVDCRRTPSADVADLFLEIPAGGDRASLEALRQLAADDNASHAAQGGQQTGDELAPWRDLVARIKAARYTAFFFQPAHYNESLLLVVRDMNRYSRVVALPLGSPGNHAGAQQVATWQTGFSSTVDFAAGYPQRDPEQNSVDSILGSGAADAALIVSLDAVADPIAALSQVARSQLANIPCVILHTADLEPPASKGVAIAVASPAIDTGGTVFRSDGVALPLRAALSSPYPNAERMIWAIGKRIEPAMAL